MIVPIICALALASIHLVADRLRISALIPRAPWLSAASGASVAFVFLLLLPELAARQQDLVEAAVLPDLSHHVWFAGLIGIVGFYGVEHWILTHGEARSEATHGAFLGHVGIFALYNVVIGYLLFDPHPQVVDGVVPYALALGFHLLVIDDAMRRHHPNRYHSSGRWILAGAVLFGAIIGATTELHHAIPALALAVLAGGIILNALKEELPEEREGRMWPFLAGVVAFAALIFVVTTR